MAKLAVEKQLCVLAVWLHVRAGVSRAVCNAVLIAMALIVQSIVVMLSSAMESHGIKVRSPSFDIPRDVRTAYKKYFPEPDIQRDICCPKCFNKFSCPIDEIPLTCPWRPSPKTKDPCGAALWTTRQSKAGGKSVPACLYTTQSLQSWLRTFLARKVIDDALHATHSKQAGGVNPNKLHDIHDTPGWRSIYTTDRGPYDLVFGLYIDWFQVFKLKIAGEI